MKEPVSPKAYVCASLIAALATSATLVPGSSQASTDHYGPATNYRLHCEGCHKEDGSGQPGYIPSLRGNVSRFLATPEGRAYIARVPGTAQSLLTDAERADVLNWIVRTFDPTHLPNDFAPYTESELARWRYDALSHPGIVRASLLASLDHGSPAAVSDSSPASNPTPAAPAGSPPGAFAVCAACHTVSADGAPGIGPNLHGVVGRESGSAPGFSYSAALKRAGLKWTRENLDEYLQSPGTKVPGNLMMYLGQPDPAARKIIIDYLESLR